MAAPPPSYGEATARADWLALAAPYVHPDDHASLCRVCRRGWALFAPRLWGDVLGPARRAGLDPGDDLLWWFAFVFHGLACVRPATRALVRVLDARAFAKDTYHFASDQDGGLLAQSFERALHLLPGVCCILIDGHADLDPARLLASAAPPLRLLSIAGCPNRLPASFFALTSLQDLVYLDVSGIPGSLSPLLHPALLPRLRILKVRAREIDDAALHALARSFARRLWSLDLSRNKVTDASLDVLREFCMPAASLRSGARFAVEGRLVTLPYGSTDYGEFSAVEESEWSATFSHPERHFADDPGYAADAAVLPSGPLRSDGASLVWSDEAGAWTRILSRSDAELHVADLSRSRGLSRLHLSGNQVSSLGLQKLLRTSSGHLEGLDCASMPLLARGSPGRKHWPVSTALHGMVGAAHLFRPVYASNLRVLRIHHSLVTHVLTLESAGLSALARIHLAETSVLARVDEAYPQAFVPDMNPRLASLTLTRIPRRSSGPLLARLIRFLHLLSVQERGVAAAAAACRLSWRGPRLLQGLRRLVLEFDPDPMDDGFATADGCAVEASPVPGGRGFCAGQDHGRPLVTVASQPRPAASPHSSAATSPRCLEPDRDSQDTTTCDGEWNGEPYSVPVWVGPRTPGFSGALHEYRRLVLDCRLRDGVGPASPGQCFAGAPRGSYVSHVAWCAAVMPPRLQPPAAADLARMRDVLAELKAYRRAGRAEYARLQGQTGDVPTPVESGGSNLYWTGSLSVVTHVHSLSSWT